jgi:hypothetical protein
VRWVLVAAALTLTAGCSTGTTAGPFATNASPPPPPASTLLPDPAPSTTRPPSVSPTASPAGCHTRRNGTLPDRRCTPGAVSGVNRGDVCPHVNPALEKNRPSQAVRERVYRAYGITHRKPGEYEVDHLVPLELDGANTPDNLWPETNDHPARSVLNSKDLVENRLHRLVCSGKMSLATAQLRIARDWTTALPR